MTLERPLESVDRIATASWHIQKAIDCSESSVAVTIDRAHAHAQIATALLQLHDAEQLQAPAYVDALSEHTRTSDSFALGVVERIMRDAKRHGVNAIEALDQIEEALKEAGKILS